MPEIFKAFKDLYNHYLHRGFRITTVHSDGNFGPLNVLIEFLPGGLLVNLASANEHFPDINRRIRAAKEQCRANRHGLLFQKMPKLLTTHILLKTVKMLNLFLTKGGISDSLIPKTIISGKRLYFKITSVYI